MSKPTPESIRGSTPYLIVRDAPRAIEFYQQAFAAREVFRIAMPDGKIGHAEIQIGSSLFMLGEEFPDWGFRGPQTLGGSPVSITLHVEDADAVFAHVVSCGATVVQAVEDQFFGDRSGKISDPFGHSWTIATKIEDVSPAEMQRRCLANYQ